MEVYSKELPATTVGEHLAFSIPATSSLTAMRLATELTAFDFCVGAFVHSEPWILCWVTGPDDSSLDAARIRSVYVCTDIDM